jgi:hypothetical protein
MEENNLTVGEILKRMPLAQACYEIMGQVFSGALLDDVWERGRGNGYERKLTFKMVVELVESALLRHHGSGRKSFDEAQEAKRLTASRTATYGKLGRIPLAVSVGLLQSGSEELGKLVPEGVFANPLPKCFDEFQVLVADGKIVKRLPHLLKLLRGARAAVLGGKASVLLDMRTRLALGVAVSGDGYADELALTRQILDMRHGLHGDSRPILMVLDRLYCNREIPALCLQNGSHFIIRFGGNMKFREDPEQTSRESQDAQGHVVVERRGYVNVRRGAPLYVRQVTCQLGKDKVLRVITDLVNEKQYPAVAVLEAYRGRWSIESVFHLVTKTFGLNRLIVTTPQGTVFQLAFCLLLHNIVQTLKLILAEQSGHPVERISTQKLLEDVDEQLIAMHVMLPIHVIVGQFQLTTPQSAVQVLNRLRILLKGLWRPRWMKAPKQRRNPPTPKRRILGNQVSAYREIQKHRPSRQRC